MDFQLPIQIKTLPQGISYHDKMMLMGSCFTEHIGEILQTMKFDVMQNPHGILFDPASVAHSLLSYLKPKTYGPEDLFFMNELWQSWHHHSSFSSTDRDAVCERIHQAQLSAHSFLKQAKWLIVTLGTSFSYRFSDQIPTEMKQGSSGDVANCHRAPGGWFVKHLMTIEEINAALDTCIHQLFQFNTEIQVIFTVSPVRHIRDGIVENNRSKARLIETVHYLVNKFDRIHYFPSYELVIDILRDYRFYDIDLVHPNYAATEYVLEKFSQHCIDKSSQMIMQEVRRIVIARKHKAFQPNTKAHQRFLKEHFEKTKLLKSQYPFLNLDEELDYFSVSGK